MKIDETTLATVAHLARLEVKEENQAALIKDMNNILEFMDKLNEVDTDQVKPLVYMTDEANVLRVDEIKRDLSKEEVLMNAPDHDSNFFRVAKVINKP